MPTACRGIAELYALGLLAEAEAKEFETHLDRCEACRFDLEANRALLVNLTRAVTPRPEVREKLFDFTFAPRTPIQVEALEWKEIAPGVRLHVFRDDFPRGVRSELIWTQAGAARPSHRHVGDEDILVLEGRLDVSGDPYDSGEICRVRAGLTHAEQAVDGRACISYVVHRVSELPGCFEGNPDAECLRCAFYPIHSAAFPKLAP